MKCSKCEELKEVPTFFNLLQEILNLTRQKSINTFHRRGHRIFE